ncbi:unnamed protein product [Symbiodinium necroappetens]|uniref:Uncharacterized protein n=1 Tax=Symbiodinium necroappetens TaxID=1628268 RepID=A0A813CLV5_9DINO|nr:unnamed protein product [Symbiodinium necroappetens]
MPRERQALCLIEDSCVAAQRATAAASGSALAVGEAAGAGLRRRWLKFKASDPAAQAGIGELRRGLRHGRLASACLRALRAPAAQQCGANFFLDEEAGYGIISAVQAGRVAVMAVVQAVVFGQAQLRGRGEQAGLESVKSEFARLMCEQCLRAGSGGLAAGLVHIPQTEEEVRAGSGVKASGFAGRAQPGKDPAAGGRVAGETAKVHCERLAMRAGLGLVAGSVQACRSQAEGAPLDALGVPPAQAGVDAEQSGAQPEAQGERHGGLHYVALPGDDHGHG